ncbi:MAG: GNAT family N-acetyltransferase, partial [Streptosporangiaceae bacterium]
MTNLPGGRGVTGLPVRRLTAADLPACSVLAVDRGWQPTPENWRLLFELGEIYGVDDPGGGLAGAVGLTRYGPGLASIGKMLVANRHGRQGLGGRLMRHAMGQAGDAVICLLATEHGRPLYERLGFRAIDRFVRYIGPLAADQPGRGEPGPAQAGPAEPREVSP